MKTQKIKKKHYKEQVVLNKFICLFEISQAFHFVALILDSTKNNIK